MKTGRCASSPSFLRSRLRKARTRFGSLVPHPAQQLVVGHHLPGGEREHAQQLDPAQSSSIVLTTVTDVTGFFSVLGIGTLMAGLI